MTGSPDKVYFAGEPDKASLHFFVAQVQSYKKVVVFLLFQVLVLITLYGSGRHWARTSDFHRVRMAL